jgi:hypothetical protein
MSADTTSTTAKALERRLEALRGQPAWSHYVEAREHVLVMLDFEQTDPSAYWSEELAGFEYLLDASPLIVDKLRHHSYHVTGLKPYDYRTGKDAAGTLMAEKRDALLQLGDRSLLVPEPQLLGGFGHEIDGRLYNIDTLKYFEVLIALERGAVLPGLREHPGRPLVWEIGAGWGGLAYALKTVVPNATYVISDLPQLFLFSGTYLPTVLPEARIAWLHNGAEAAAFDAWDDHDIVFTPHFALAQLRPPHVELALNTVSFQEMTSAQVEAYCEHAHALGSPYLYSLNRDRGGYNRELSNVHESMARWYWPHEQDLLPVPYTRMLDRAGMKAAKSGRENRYRHVVGWRRQELG